METLARLNAQMGVTVVFVSHAAEDRAYASKTITLADGIVESEEGS
ncbi:hypothetical protein [Demequina sp.]|nr:hypothetical protein [Demequina sp.]